MRQALGWVGISFRQTVHVNLPVNILLQPGREQVLEIVRVYKITKEMLLLLAMGTK